MMIQVLVNGAKGKMGAQVVSTISQQQDMQLVAMTDLGDDLAGTLREKRPAVAVDFTHPSCVYENTKTIVEAGVAGVIGTTGLTQEQLKTLHALAETHETGLLVAPNFCIGAVLMMEFSKQAARFFPNVEIIEQHHPAKADAPSGTASLTARLAASAMESTSASKPEASGKEIPFRGGIVNGVHVHSVRLPGLVAHQEVIFGTEGQTLTIRHDSLSRISFMTGVLQGIRSVSTWKGLAYGLDKLLFADDHGIETGV